VERDLGISNSNGDIKKKQDIKRIENDVRVLEGLDDDISDLLVLKEEEHELKVKLHMEIEHHENLKTLSASKHTMLQNQAGENLPVSNKFVQRMRENLHNNSSRSQGKRNDAKT